MADKGRILEHMNVDHRVALFDYLAYYGGIRLDVNNRKHGVELVDVALDHLVLNYHKQPNNLRTTTISLDPPMQDMGAARWRFISMAFEAADGMHVSPYRITKLLWPTSAAAWITAVIMSGLGIVSISPSGFRALVSSRSERIAKALEKWARKAFLLLVSAHLAEYLVVLRPKLAFHRANLATRLKWLSLLLFIGYPQLQRFDAEARRLALHRAKYVGK